MIQMSIFRVSAILSWFLMVRIKKLWFFVALNEDRVSTTLQESVKETDSILFKSMNSIHLVIAQASLV